MGRGIKTAAEQALHTLLIGATFVGAHWYGTLVAVLARVGPAPDGGQYDVAYDEVYLSIESRFVLFDKRPATLPDRAEDIQDAPFHVRVGIIARLAQDPITDVTLGEPHPHLILTFESGRVFFLNGKNDEYEPWTVETAGAAVGEWIIVATPGSGIAIFEPGQGPEVTRATPH